MAGLADDRGVDGDLAAHAERGLGQGQRQLQQRVGARRGPGCARPAAATAAAAEEGLEHVAEAAEPGERVARRPGALRQRVAAEVDDAPLLGVGEHLVGGR